MLIPLGILWESFEDLFPEVVLLRVMLRRQLNRLGFFVLRHISQSLAARVDVAGVEDPLTGSIEGQTAVRLASASHSTASQKRFSNSAICLESSGVGSAPVFSSA